MRVAMISSTSRDLLDHREEVMKACQKKDFVPRWMEILPAGKSPMEASLGLLEGADVYIGIFAHRYGDSPDGSDVSYTEAEYLYAMEKGILVLPFFIDETLPVVPAMFDTGVDGEKLKDLKNRIRKAHAVDSFTTPADLAGKVMFALDKHFPAPAPLPGVPIPPSDPDDSIEAYRQRMVEETGRLPLMGLGSKLNEVSLPISDAYVELETQAMAPAQDQEADHKAERLERLQERVPVTKLFPSATPRTAVLVLGDPGAGKTTVTKRIFWELASGFVPPSAYGLPEGTFPVLLKLQRLLPGEILRDPARIPRHFAETKDLLRRFLDEQTASPDLPDRKNRPGEALWNRGKLLWILDGLDEIPNAQARDLTLKKIAAAVAARHDTMGDRFLVTSRFSGTEGQEVEIPDCFARFDVKGLPQPRREELVRKFFATVAPVFKSDPVEATTLANERTTGLLAELAERQNQPGIAGIAGNPLILTILCVVYWEEQKLPHGRADIYDRCLDVFLRHRAKVRRDGFADAVKPFDPVKARKVLGTLAWWLHERRERGASLEEFAGCAVEALRNVDDPAVGVDGRAFVEDRMGRECGVIVTSSGRKEFLHLTFQEFLTAEHALAERRMNVVAQGLGDKWWHEPAFHALRKGSEKDAAEFFGQLLVGGSLAKTIAAANEEFNATELFGELVRDATAFPAQPFLEFFKTRPREEIARVVIKALSSRGHLPPDLARAAGELAGRSKEREIRIGGPPFSVAQASPCRPRSSRNGTPCARMTGPKSPS